MMLSPNGLRQRKAVTPNSACRGGGRGSSASTFVRMVSLENEPDIAWLFKVRVVVARIGEMDLARWWNSTGQLGPQGASVLRRGLPRTHHFAQARSVCTIAAARCAQIFDHPGSVTL